MKIPLEILRISAGKIEDNGMLYANAFILDNSIANTIEADRIDVGQQQAKVTICTNNENALSKKLASTGVVPSSILCEVETAVKKGIMTMKIVGFDLPKAS